MKAVQWARKGKIKSTTKIQSLNPNPDILMTESCLYLSSDAQWTCGKTDIMILLTRLQTVSDSHKILQQRFHVYLFIYLFI